MQTLGDVITAIRTKPIRKLLAEKRLSESYCKYEEIPLAMKNMAVSMEDSLFFQHSGFLWIGFVNAMLENLRQRRLVRGGSTITMQLAKNLYLSQERTLRRKFLEFLVTVYLEHRLSKEEILELYLNIIYYGNGIYGIRNACKYYFDEEPEELSINQAITLASLLPAPTWNNPCTTEGREHLYIWRDRVLADLCRRQILPEEDLGHFRCAPWNQVFSGSLDHTCQEKLYRRLQEGFSFWDYLKKLGWRGHVALWKIEASLLRKGRKGTVTKAPNGINLQLVFVDGPSANTKALLELLDRYGIKACFGMKSTLCDQWAEEIEKRGHCILKDNEKVKRCQETCGYRMTELSPWETYREVISGIKESGKSEIVLQDIWRMNNILVDRIILWGIRKGYF